MPDKITRIEWACLEGHRPRNAGSNARLGQHGRTVRVPILRVTTAEGASGFGHSWASEEEASGLLGQSVESLFDAVVGVPACWRAAEYPLWDLAGQQADLPVYALAARVNQRPVPGVCWVPVYDTSLYFDDLHPTTDEEAAALIAAEALDGAALGHRAFKLKVGRGARWMPIQEGTRRDIAVIQAVRAAVGPEAALMLDANNGWNLNLTKQVLAETADCRVHWTSCISRLALPGLEIRVFYRAIVCLRRHKITREGPALMSAKADNRTSKALHFQCRVLTQEV